MPPLYESVAALLCGHPPSTISWKAKAAHPSKPCRTTTALARRSYASIGQAASALHSTAVLQVFQAKLLSSMDESEPEWLISTWSFPLDCLWPPKLLWSAWTHLFPLWDRWESAFSTTSMTGSFLPNQKWSFIAQNPPHQPPRASGAQLQLRQKHAVSQPTNIIPGNSSQLDSNESHSHARTCFSHARARALLRDRCHSPSQDVSKDAGPHGRSVTGASIFSASLVTSSPLAETTSSITCVPAYQVPAYQGEPGLCNIPSPLKRPSLDGKGHAWEWFARERLSRQMLCEGKPTFGHWLKAEKRLHINCLEMLAVCRAWQFFLPDLKGHHVLIRSDSMSVVSYINHQGGLSSKRLCLLAE